MENVLKLLKADLGIKSTARDEYFSSLLKADFEEIKRKGVVLDLTAVEDQVLLSDYTAYKYRHRHENVSLARNIQLRIRNRIMRKRAQGGGGDDESE